MWLLEWQNLGYHKQFLYPKVYAYFLAFGVYVPIWDTVIPQNDNIYAYNTPFIFIYI